MTNETGKDWKARMAAIGQGANRCAKCGNVGAHAIDCTIFIVGAAERLALTRLTFDGDREQTIAELRNYIDRVKGRC